MFANKNPKEESEEHSFLLENANASIAMHWENHGHQLTRREVESVANLYYKNF